MGKGNSELQETLIDFENDRNSQVFNIEIHRLNKSLTLLIKNNTQHLYP
jgi:hypothetical protein